MKKNEKAYGRIVRLSTADTLDEPVTKTIVRLVYTVIWGFIDFELIQQKARDLFSIYSKLVQVLYPRRTSGREVLRLACGRECEVDS